MTSRGTNALAVASVVAGALSWAGLPIVGSAVAILCGHLARTEIQRSGEEGAGLALLGLVLGYSNLLACCLVFALLVLLYAGLFAVVGWAETAGSM